MTENQVVVKNGILPKRKQKRKITLDEFTIYAVKHKGSIREIARSLDISSQDVHKFIAKNRDYCNKVINEIRQHYCDIAERNIFHALDEGNVDVAKYYLNLFGKERGYSNKQEVDVNAIQINFTFNPPAEFISVQPNIKKVENDQNDNSDKPNE
jgi:hypothetical protein